MFSASTSASGISSIVSRDEILGDRERKDVGVDGMLEEEKLELEGKGSLYCVAFRGGLDVLARSGIEVGALRWFDEEPANGDRGRRRVRGNVLCMLSNGELGMPPSGMLPL